MNAWFDVDAPAWRLAGWTMLHFLWTGTLAAAVGAAVRLACRRATPGMRYAASMGMLALIAATPVGVAAWLALHPTSWEAAVAATTDSVGASDGADENAPIASRTNAATTGRLSEAPNAAAQPRIVELKPEASAPLRNDGSAPPVVELSSRTLATPASAEGAGIAEDVQIGNPSPSRSLPADGEGAPLSRLVGWLPAAWLVGAPLTFMWLAVGLVGSQRLRSGSAAIDDGPVVEAYERLAASFGMARRVALAVCDRLAQPVLVGIVRPTILLPASALSGWSPEEIEMVLLHELAHVRRWDNFVNLIQRVIESLLFFHPCVWLASRQVRRDREECCDALVVQHTQRPEAYATLLVSIATLGRSRPKLAAAQLAAASAMANHALAGRLRRILKLEDHAMRVSRGTMGLTAAAIIGLFAAVCLLPASGGAAADEANEVDAAEAGATGNDEKPYVIHYTVPDLTPVDLRQWLAIVSHEDVDVRWNVDKQIMAVLATRDVHDRIAKFLDMTRNSTIELSESDATEAADTALDVDELQSLLDEARATLMQELAGLKEQEAASGGADAVEFELPKLKADISRYQAQLIAMDKELADIEVLKQVAIAQANSPAALNEAVERALKQDPMIAQYKQLLFAIDQIIQHFASTHRTASPESKRIQHEREETQKMMEAYRAKAEREILERFTDLPNEELRAAIVEYNVRARFIAEKKAELAEKLHAAEARINEMSIVDPELAMLQQNIESLQSGIADLEKVLASGHAADADTNARSEVEQSLEREVAELRRKIELAKRQRETQFEEQQDSAANPLDLAAALAILERAERGNFEDFWFHGNSLGDQFPRFLRMLQAFFHESSENPLERATYLVSDMPMAYRGKGAIKTSLDVFVNRFLQKLNEAPDGPRLSFVWTLKDSGKTLEIEAPRAAQRYFRIMLSPQFVAAVKGDAEATVPFDEAAAPTRWNLGPHARNSVTMACLKILAQEPALAVNVHTEGDDLFLEAPAPVHDALMDCFNQIQRLELMLELKSRRIEDGRLSDQAEAELTRLERESATWQDELQEAFQESDDNPRISVVHSVEAFDKFANYPHAAVDALEGLVKDPYGPRLAMDVQEIDDGKRIRVIAALAGHVWLRLLLTEDSPWFAFGMKQRELDAAGEAAEDAAAEERAREAVAGGSGEDSNPGDAKLAAALESLDKAENGNFDDIVRASDEKQFDRFLEVVFHATDANPEEQRTYDLAKFAPRYRSRTVFENVLISLLRAHLEPLNRESGRPQVMFNWQSQDGGKTYAITAPRAAHRYLAILFSPEFLAAIQSDAGTAREEGDEASEPFGGEAADPFGEGEASNPFAAQGSPQAAEVRPSSDEGARAPAGDGPFLTLEEQRVADRAYKALGWELEPLEDEHLARAKELGFEGGLRIVDSNGQNGRMSYGDLLVGLHVWPVKDFKSLDAVLSRPDLAKLTPIKYYLVSYDSPNATNPRSRIKSGRANINAYALRDETPAEEAALADPAAAAGDLFGTPTAAPPAGPYRLKAGDLIQVRVVGALADEPISDAFIIEDEGTIALGPSYGRATVAGRTIRESEEAITELLKEILADFRVQVTLVAKSSGGDLSAYGPAAPPAGPYRLHAGDVIQVRVAGASPEEPILGKYRIEEEGTIALGPTYGRATVAGLTIREAETAITELLKEILSDPHVQVTLVSRSNPAAVAWPGTPADEPAYLPTVAGQPYEPGAGPADETDETLYLYDGKTFGEWQQMWKIELKLDRRMEAIEALAAFARAGFGREAAEALLDVAGEYNFGMIDGSPEGQLKNRVIELLTSPSSASVSPLDWLPPLMERMAADHDKWTPLTSSLFSQMYTASPDARRLILKFASDPKYGPNGLALRMLLQSSRDGDPLQNEVERLVRDALAGEDSANALDVLRVISITRVSNLPEAFELLFHKDPDVRRSARTLLQPQRVLDRQRDKYEALVDKLLAVLDDPKRAADHVDAIRALAALQSYIAAENDVRTRIAKRFGQLLEDGDARVLTSVAAAIRRLMSQEEINDALGALSEERRKVVNESVDDVNEEQEQIVDEAQSSGGGFGGGGFGGGGGGFGGGGGGFF